MSKTENQDGSSVRFASPADLRRYRAAIKNVVAPEKTCVYICAGTGCTASGGIELTEAFQKEIEKSGRADTVTVRNTGCHGFCERGPVVVVRPQGIFYQWMTLEDAAEVVRETLVNGRVVERLLYTHPRTGEAIPLEHDVPFYRKQKRVVLKLNGIVDPREIDDYLVHGGYESLAKAIGQMTPEAVLSEVERSGLRGRGGAGFPTGRKWRTCREAEGDLKYIVCNADEGDPGAFMDRSVLEGNPHLVLEGMLLGAYAIGASEGYVYVRAEYPLAVKHIRMAIEQAEARGLLGHNILGNEFCFHLHVKEGAGAFVCGEETALLASIEGRRGMPRIRPPFPAISGLWGKPTCINNVETFANIPTIIGDGADAYAAVGAEKSKGTKIFSLTGKINNTGLVEVPIGTPLSEVIWEIGGGIPRGRKFKAAQMGGPSGGCIPAQFLDLPIDYESLSSVGSMMGSGGLIVMDENTCMVDIARFFLAFTQSESCGKCVPCRVGTYRMLEILERITRGEGRMEDLDELEELALAVKDASLCGLGQTAPNPVLSTLKYFRDEYIAHIREKRCPAASCEALAPSPCSHACPADTDVENYVGLIRDGRYTDALSLIMETNPFPQVCGRVCVHPCERRCRRGEVDEPISVMELKRFAAQRGWPKDGHVPLRRLNVKRGKKVAVVGAGPAGLSCAGYLARLGWPVTVFEALPVAGGMLAVGIPDYRLPKKILALEVENILSFGVDLRLNSPVKGEGALRSLMNEQGYGAVFIATGAHRSTSLRVEGEDLPGVLKGVDFLREMNLGNEIKLKGRVAVIGGGNVALDAARSALRLGADSVKIIYRRTRDEMPANAEEIEWAIEEGVAIEYLVAPVRILAGSNGSPLRLETLRMQLGPPDTDGRRKPVPIEGSETTEPYDTIISAVGQQVDVSFLDADGPAVQRGTIFADTLTLATSESGIFAGGDVVLGPATAIEAVGHGRRAARGIHLHLGGSAEDLKALEHKEPYAATLAPGEPSEGRRVHPPTLPPGERVKDFREVVLDLEEEKVIAEASRCLRCSKSR